VLEEEVVLVMMARWRCKGEGGGGGGGKKEVTREVIRYHLWFFFFHRMVAWVGKVGWEFRSERERNGVGILFWVAELYWVSQLVLWDSLVTIIRYSWTGGGAGVSGGCGLRVVCCNHAYFMYYMPGFHIISVIV
jgi:hypothetical protein